MSNTTHRMPGASSRPAIDPGLVRLLAEALQTQASFVRDTGNLLYIYQDGVYTAEAEQHVKREVKRLLIAWDASRRWSQHLVAEVLGYIAADAPQLWERPPLELLNVANGLLDLHTRQVQAHTPAFLSTVQLPVHYDPLSVEAQAWDTFLSGVLPPDVYDAGIIFQLLALLMIPYTDAHQAVLLTGPGGNGKSVLLRAIRSFLGELNVSSLNLDQLSDRFGAAGLHGRLANIVDDLSSRHLSDTSTFKRIVAGDLLTADRKYREPLVFRPFARLVFSTNELPQVWDSSDGFYDRWLVIPFSANFRGQQGEVRQQTLAAQLAAPKELSAVLNRALAMLPSVLELRLPMTPSMKAAWDEYRGSTDWVLLWLERMLIEHPVGVVEKKTIHQALLLEAQRQRRAVLSPAALYKKIRNHWPQIDESQRRLDPQRNSVPCFVGLAWRSGVSPLV